MNAAVGMVVFFLVLITSAEFALVASNSASRGPLASSVPVTWVAGSPARSACSPVLGKIGMERGTRLRRYTASKFGLVAGDRGYSFEFEGHVWWLFEG
jgi:hypothetical protein